MSRPAADRAPTHPSRRTPHQPCRADTHRSLFPRRGRLFYATSAIGTGGRGQRASRAPTQVAQFAKAADRAQPMPRCGSRRPRRRATGRVRPRLSPPQPNEPTSRRRRGPINEPISRKCPGIRGVFGPREVNIRSVIGPWAAPTCRKPSPPRTLIRATRDGYQLWELPGPGIGHVPTYRVEQGRPPGRRVPDPRGRGDRHRDGPRSALPRLRARLRRGRRRRGEARVVRLRPFEFRGGIRLRERGAGVGQRLETVRRRVASSPLCAA